MLTARSSSGPSLPTLLQVAHQAPAGLVERGRHQRGVHGQGPDVEPSHPGHGVTGGLAPAWGKGGLANLPVK